MVRAPGRTPAPPNDRSARNALVMVGVGIILLFALVGVVSAGVFLGGKVTGSSHPATAKATATSTASRVALQNVARAQAQATRIVRTAQQTGRSIVSQQNSRARKQAAAILSAARQKAARIASSAHAAAPAPTSAPVAAGTTPQSGSISGASGVTLAPTAIGGAQSGTTGPTAPLPSNLSGVPASWLVVAYNASFGTGPGSAGSISVVNRSRGALSGVARVAYKRGGVASAPFSRLAPGQALTLALNGPVYPGGGYTIQVVGVR